MLPTKCCKRKRSQISAKKFKSDKTVLKGGEEVLKGLKCDRYIRKRGGTKGK